MAIYLHPIDEQPIESKQKDWVEIDLVSWQSSDGEYPIGFTLLRRLNPKSKQPYLQELMFEGLYKGRPINQLRLEIPSSKDENRVDLYILNNVKVINYKIYPHHPNNKSSYEKIILAAKNHIKKSHTLND